MNLRRLSFLAGVACGYVLGTRAGRERYDALMTAARRIADQPAVQGAAGLIAAQVSGVLSRSSRPDTVDLTVGH